MIKESEKTIAYRKAYRQTDEFKLRKKLYRQTRWKKKIQEYYQLNKDKHLYKDNRDKLLAYQRKRNNSIPKEEWIKKATKPLSEWNCNVVNPKLRANSLVLRAVRKGRIIKPHSCSKCGFSPEDIRYIHGHHKDYSLWWKVEWLCKDCHWRIHYGHSGKLRK